MRTLLDEREDRSISESRTRSNSRVNKTEIVLGVIDVGSMITLP